MFNNNFNLFGSLIPLKLADRNSATIKGKSIEEVTKAIDAMLEEDKFEETHDHFFYISIEKMEQRLREIVGPFGYIMMPIPIQTQEIRYTAIPNKRKMQEKATREGRQLQEEELVPAECVSFMEKVITALAIYSDSGELAIVRYAYGAAPYIFDGTSGRITAPCNVPQSAFSDASKRACKELGIGRKQLDEKNSKKKNAGHDKTFQNDKEYRIKITGQFSTVGNGFKAPAILIENDKQNEEIFLLIWPNGIKEIEKRCPMDKFIKSYVGKEITVIGSFSRKTIRGNVETQLTMSSIK